MLLRSSATGRPHDVPVAVVAPAVVAKPWTARVNDLAGRPFAPVVVDGRTDALQAVVDGAVVAALTGTRLHRGAGPGHPASVSRLRAARAFGRGAAARSDFRPVPWRRCIPTLRG
jgi:hypothetical protein